MARDHGTAGRGDELISFRDGLTLVYGMLRIHREIIIRLAREIDDLSTERLDS